MILKVSVDNRPRKSEYEWFIGKGRLFEKVLYVTESKKDERL